MAPRAARRHLEDVLLGHGEVVSIAQLLVTELVTNSVRHGGRRDGDHVEVRVSLEEDRLRVEVRDEGGGVGPLEPLSSSEGGFGLLFVNSLADRWGSERRPNGTTVWFELELELE
jgi:two-component sensor histidine kinase